MPWWCHWYMCDRKHDSNIIDSNIISQSRFVLLCDLALGLQVVPNLMIFHRKFCWEMDLASLGHEVSRWPRVGHSLRNDLEQTWECTRSDAHIWLCDQKDVSASCVPSKMQGTFPWKKDVVLILLQCNVCLANDLSLAGFTSKQKCLTKSIHSL